MTSKILTTVSFIVFSGVSFAGGDYKPVESKTIEIPQDINTYENRFYIGIGLSDMRLYNDLTDEEFSSTSVTLQVGYELYDNLSIEGRYSTKLSNLEYSHGITVDPDYDDYPADFSNIALYLKPNYSIDDINLYALLGYGRVSITNIPLGDKDRAEDSFQWGLGLAYKFSDSLSLFVDYINFYDSVGFDYRALDADIISDAWSVGISYKF